MLPHPDTFSRIDEHRIQERLRHVAEQRRAASAENCAWSRPTTGWPAWRNAISWITGWRMGVRATTRVLAADSREGGCARTVHPVA
jgi:hypothetical protein